MPATLAAISTSGEERTASKMSGHEHGKTMKYPYTLAGKVMQFPWVHYWKHGRGIRYIGYALVLSYPVFYQLHKFVNSPGNVEMWTKIRHKRHHDVFARPTE